MRLPDFFPSAAARIVRKTLPAGHPSAGPYSVWRRAKEKSDCAERSSAVMDSPSFALRNPNQSGSTIRIGNPMEERLSRRGVLKSLAGAAAVATLPPAVIQVFARTPAEPPKKQQTPKSSANVQNPAWYGFNLFEYFSTDPDWMKYFPYKNDGMFVEDDFRWIRDWGFNFVRLPMDYRFWTDPNDLMKIHEQKVEPIDRAIRLGEKYGIHVNICLHRAPGYCQLDQQDPAIGMIRKADLERGNLSSVHITVEETNLFQDLQALEAFVYQWTFFAQRYKGISSERLSFNLVNEPLPPMTHAEREALSVSFNDPNGRAAFPGDRARAALRASQAGPPAVGAEISGERMKEYSRVARVAIGAIRSIDPQRLIVSDGEGGATPIPELIDTGVLQSRHGYMPSNLTLYQAEWLPRQIKQPTRVVFTSDGTLSGTTGSDPSGPPHWPVVGQLGNVVVDRHTIEQALWRWQELEQKAVRIHFGEMGCYKYTPHKVMLAWFKDNLGVIGKLHSGWALRNFRGPFGILDTERAGTKFEDWHGHQLDRALLNLLQEKMSS